VYTVDLDETAAAGIAAQAAAVLHGAKVVEVADAWAPAYRPAAEPRPDPGAAAVLDRYRRLAAWPGLDRDPLDETP
jgi:hypothetical protein